MIQLLKSIGLMEDDNEDGINDTSINHLGWNAPIDWFGNPINITTTDSMYSKYGLNVCFDVLIHTWGYSWGNEMKWIIKGYETNTSCESNRAEQSMKGYTYSQRCCLPTRENVFNLTCIDTFVDGWHNANIEIEGRYYCQNFKGGRITVIVPNPAKQRCENGKSTKMYLSFVL